MKFLGYEINKSSELTGRFRSDGMWFERTADGFFISKDLFDKSNSNALISMYQDIPEIQTPINYMIDKLANVKFYHVKMIGSREKIIEDSYIFDVLKNPNQFQKQSDFIKSFFLNRIVFGAGFINRVKSIGLEGYRTLFILPSATTMPIISETNKEDIRLNNVLGYKTDFGKGKVTLNLDEVCVQYEANLSNKPNDICSRLTSAIMASESLRYNYEARVKIYKDRGALGVLSPKDPTAALNKETADKLKKQYYRENGITKGKAPFLVGSRSLEYTQIGMNVGDLKLNENKSQDFQTVCNVLSVDPALFDNSNSTYNNKILAKRNFWEDVGMPFFNSYLELLQEVFNLPPNEKLKADYSDIPAMQDDLKTKVGANSTAYKDGAITQAEYREAIGYEGGDDKYIFERQSENSNQEGSGQTDGDNESEDDE